MKVLFTSVWLVSQSDQTWPRESVDEGRQEVIQLVDDTVTVFPILRVLFAWDAFNESTPPVATESRDAFEATFEVVVIFESVAPVASNSKGAVNAASEDVSGVEDVPPVVSVGRDAFGYSDAVFALSRVLFANGVISEPVPPVASESREAFDVAFGNVYEFEDAVFVSTFSSSSPVAI